MLVSSARDAFPSALKDDAEAVAMRLTNARGLKSQSTFTVTVDGEKVSIPSRVYFDSIQIRMGYSALQVVLLDCLLTRHDSGFVRESAIRRVLSLNTPWSVPFVVQLISEYVIEILVTIERSWGQIDEPVLARFLAENPRFHALVRQRVVSYWNVYYRHFKRDEYVGFRLLKKLDLLRSGHLIDSR